MILVEEYGAKLRRHYFARASESDEELPDFQELEKSLPELQEIRRRATADFSVKVGQSSYFRETDALYGEAEFAWMNGGSEEADRKLDRILEIDPLHAKARTSRAWIALSDERFDDVIRWTTAAIEHHKGLTLSWILRSAAYLGKALLPNHFLNAVPWRQRCLADAERALQIDDRCIEAYIIRGVARSGAQDWKGTIEDFSRVIELDPRYGWAYQHRGDARNEQRDLDGAIADFTRAIEIFPTGQAYHNRGACRLNKKDWKNAIADFDRSIDLTPQDADPYYGRGLARAAQKDYQGAISDMTRALQINPKLTDAYYNRAIVRYNDRDASGAIADLDRYIVLRPKHVNAYYARGLARIAMKDADGAAEDFQHVLDLGTADDTTRKNAEASLAKLRAALSPK